MFDVPEKKTIKPAHDAQNLDLKMALTFWRELEKEYNTQRRNATIKTQAGVKLNSSNKPSKTNNKVNKNGRI